MDTQKLIAAGGNLWEKPGIQRIYLNDAAICTLLDLNEEDALKIKRLKAAKKQTYYAVNNQSFYSANGMIIRNAIRAKFPTEAVNKI